MTATHGADGTPVAMHVGPSADALYRTGQNQLLLIGAATGPKSGMDPQNESMGSEVWTRYGIGSMYQARSEARGGARFDLCELSAPGAHGITELVSDLNFSSIADENFRVGDLVLWRRPGKNPAHQKLSLVLATQCAHDSR